MLLKGTAMSWWFELQEPNCDWVLQDFLLLHMSYIRKSLGIILHLLKRCKWDVGSFIYLTFFNINTEPTILVKPKNQCWCDFLS